MNFSIILFVANRLSEIPGGCQRIAKTFYTIQNVDLPPAINYYTTMNTKINFECASFCLHDEACMGSVFTGDSCHLVSEYVLSSQLQANNGHEFLTQYKCIPGYTSKFNCHEKVSFWK